MRPQDLRIGNLVEYPNWNNDNSKAYFKIRDIYFEDGKIGLTNGFIQLPSTRLQRIKPIPLTEQWLLTLGLKQQGQRKMWVKDRVCVVLESYTDLSGKPTPEAFYIGFKDLGNVLFHTTLKVECVHELQNAFALTGRELTFKS